MKIETKFDFDDKVWACSRKMVYIFFDCKFCEGTGELTAKNGEAITCPKCYGRKGHRENTQRQWVVERTLTIGEIRTRSRAERTGFDDEIYDNFGNQTAEYEEGYMCFETGIGSGQIHHADTLFLSHEAAEAFCKEANKEADNA